MIERLRERGYDVDKVLNETKMSEEEMEKMLNDIESKLRDGVLGGRAAFTGNTRTYTNGAIGFECRCVNCKMLYWVTNTPYARCIDCRS